MNYEHQSQGGHNEVKTFIRLDFTRYFEQYLADDMIFALFIKLHCYDKTKNKHRYKNLKIKIKN